MLITLQAGQITLQIKSKHFKKSVYGTSLLAIYCKNPQSNKSKFTKGGPGTVPGRRDDKD